MKSLFKNFNLFKWIALLLVSFTLTLTACVEDGPSNNELVDYVSQLTLDLTTSSAKQEVTVRNYIDGDTTHFYLPESVSINGVENGVLKARYLAINTPESTGKVEPWGKAAADFTKEKLSSATSIIIESNDSNWNLDSTGGRHLVFVWYRTSNTSPYRNLNLEILQEGLAVGSSISATRYGDICNSALAQARTAKIKLYSDEEAPGYFYGEASEISLKELRTNVETYLNQKVIVEGLITRISQQTFYVEAFDEETEVSYGIQVYAGYNYTTNYPRLIIEGNQVRLVGTVQAYTSDYGTTYQISGLEMSRMNPNNLDSSRVISTGNEITPTLITASEFNNGQVVISTENEEGETVATTYDLQDLLLYTFVKMENLEVTDVYTTTSSTSSSRGAMTLTCKVGNETITVRTVVMYFDASAEQMVTADYFEGQTIDITAIVDSFDGEPQLRIFSIGQVTIH